MICKVCENSTNNEKFQIREMMFGLMDEFEYLECLNCGCIQIIKIPVEMSKYYPSHFYSFNDTNENFVKKYLRTQRNKYAYSGNGLIGKIWNEVYPAYFFDKIPYIRPNSKILDVGSGSGKLVNSFKNIGFKNVMGIDPFINRDNKGINIFKKTIHEIPNYQNFDVVIFKDSFEHISDQVETLKKVSKILSNDGICIITMPIKTDYIWKKYSTDWVQIDAPRHFFIHTLSSFKLLVEKMGLYINEVIFDSTEFQFWGSEQYKKGIPLTAKNSYLINPKKSIFTDKQIKKFKEKSKL